MLVIPKVQGLALKLNNPQIVLDSIPTAKELTVRGNNVVVLPHKLTEVWALRKLGINAPSPIMHYRTGARRNTTFAWRVALCWRRKRG